LQGRWGEPPGQSEEVAQWWGEWSSWSTCSRTCGGGVRSQERHCLQQRYRISFKQQQCSSFNSKAFGKRHYVWVPLYPDDYISISSKPCDLQCTTTTGERQLLVPAHDGTYCRDGIYQGVCIEGQCQVVGCDGKLYSSKKVDKCGVCGGTGNSCYRVSGSYRKGITQLGYLFITSIPAGATDIQIIERRKTENILALSDEAGHFFFNGNFIIDNPRNFHVAGTVFKYRRPANIFSDGLEYIISQGPTNQGLNVMYYNLNGKMPHITYEYTVPRMVEPKMATPLVLDSGFLQKHGAAAVLPEAQQSPEWDTNDTMVEVSYGSNEINVSEEYRVRNHTMLQLVLSNIVMLLSFRRIVVSLQTLSLCPSPLLPCASSNEFEVGSLDHDISLADMYRWKVSAYAPCSSTCTTGISISYALCVRFDGSEVDESHCDALTRPEPTHEFCTGKECPPRWETSRWSECSRTCGEGHQFRTVRCWRMMAPGFDSTVYDELCRAADLSKPMARKACRSQACGPQWEISAWSECSARCGGVGLQTREVRCSMDTRLCNNSTRPPAERECKGPPCDRRWTVSDWGPCSGPCGKGRMTRYVVCKNSHGSVISDVQCDLDLKPLAVYPCGDRNCPAHWVEQEWEQCNATCGRGSKTRQVVCSGLENGVFKEFPEHACDPALKPEETAACFERPCSKWFTTAWSQCSKTCGSGVKVREVKCYQGEELGHSCDSKIKPEARRVCEEQSCPTEAPEEACQDKATANCALVLKVKLCTHWYYRKACCLSCKNKAQ
uniref:Si:ch211-267e7.3 n=1 Tax=Scleropages formosus TaxID=113540 RepID=A0A8C9R5Z7_SCLFO